MYDVCFLNHFSDKNILKTILAQVNASSLYFSEQSTKFELVSLQMETDSPFPMKIYDYILQRVQAFMVGMDEGQFSIVERELIGALTKVDTSDPDPVRGFWSQRFASDCLVFVARFAPPEICRHHANYLLDEFVNKGTKRSVHLLHTIRRLSKCLLAIDIKDLISRFDPSSERDGLIAWSALDLSICKDDFKGKLVSKVNMKDIAL